MQRSAMKGILQFDFIVSQQLHESNTCLKLLRLTCLHFILNIVDFDFPTAAAKVSLVECLLFDGL